MVRFSSKNTIEFMNRLPIIQGQKIFGTTLRFSSKECTESMDRLATIQGQKMVKQRLDF